MCALLHIYSNSKGEETMIQEGNRETWKGPGKEKEGGSNIVVLLSFSLKLSFI